MFSVLVNCDYLKSLKLLLAFSVPKWYTLIMPELYSKTCQVCNKQFQFLSYPSVENRQPRKTCSKHCQYILVGKGVVRRIIRTCKYCKQQYSTITSSKKIFCSRDCQISHMRTQIGDKNPSWKPLSERTSPRMSITTLRRKMITSTTKCQDCNNVKPHLEIHHIDKNRNNNSPTNFAVLCIDCHANRHIGEKSENLIRNSARHSRAICRGVKICPQCFSEFRPYYNKHKFCTRGCSKLYRDSHTASKMKTSYCKFCNLPYIHKPSVKRDFCSRVCYVHSRKPIR